MPNQTEQNSTDGRQQDGASSKLIDNPGLAHMLAEPVRREAKGATMAERPEAERSAIAKGARVMEKFVPAQTSNNAVKIMSDMQAHPVSEKSDARQGYLRLRVRVAGDRMRVLSANQVDGPLAVSTAFAGEHAYEAVLDAQTIAFEGVPDVGVSRSYPRPGAHEHHISERQSFEITVRIPNTAVPANALSRVALTLYRFPDASQKTVSGSLTRQFGHQVKVVAHLDGLHEASLEPEAHEQLRRLFPASFSESKAQ